MRKNGTITGCITLITYFLLAGVGCKKPVIKEMPQPAREELKIVADSHRSYYNYWEFFREDHHGDSKRRLIVASVGTQRQIQR